MEASREATTKTGVRTTCRRSCCWEATTPIREASTRAVSAGDPEKNRVSAQNTRKRKKLYIDLLEAKVELLEARVVLPFLEQRDARATGELHRS